MEITIKMKKEVRKLKKTKAPDICIPYDFRFDYKKKEKEKENE